MSANKDKASWLAGLLTGWGVKESWAKVIAGAVIGALCAAGVLALDGCTGLSDEQVQRVLQAHELYHKASGKPCIFTVDKEGK